MSVQNYKQGKLWESGDKIKTENAFISSRKKKQKLQLKYIFLLSDKEWLVSIAHCLDHSEKRYLVSAEQVKPLLTSQVLGPIPAVWDLLSVLSKRPYSFGSCLETDLGVKQEDTSAGTKNQTVQPIAQTIPVKKSSPGNWPSFCLYLPWCLLTGGWKWSEVPPALPLALELWVTKSRTPIDGWTSRCVHCPAAADFLEDIWNSFSPSKFRKTYTLVKEENWVWFCRNFHNSSAKLFKFSEYTN